MRGLRAGKASQNDNDKEASQSLSLTLTYLKLFNIDANVYT